MYDPRTSTYIKQISLYYNAMNPNQNKWYVEFIPFILNPEYG